MEKLIWLWKYFWGKRYQIKYTDKLKPNEILVYSHQIFIGKEK